MPHARARHILTVLVKKLSFSRVVSLQGARQTGKSFIARELLPKIKKSSVYQSFDQKIVVDFARHNPESFLKKFSDALPLAIDEAQKAPEIFDAVKYQVDINSRPGQFLLLGSTEFSREVQVKESLTGRLSRVRVYPFTLSESENLEINSSKANSLLNAIPRTKRKNLLRYLDKGGFPGIFSVREDEHFRSLLQDWLNLVVYRDLLQFKTLSPDPDFAMNLLREVAQAPDPDAGSFAKRLGVSLPKVSRHLKMLETLFVIHKLNPHVTGGGKARYFLCDPGLAGYLEASFYKQMSTWLLLEQLSQRACFLNDRATLTYYRGARGGIIDLVISSPAEKGPIVAIKLIAEEKLDKRDFQILHAFKKKQPNQKVELCALAPVDRAEELDGVSIFPWESLA